MMCLHIIKESASISDLFVSRDELTSALMMNLQS